MVIFIKISYKYLQVLMEEYKVKIQEENPLYKFAAQQSTVKQEEPHQRVQFQRPQSRGCLKRKAKNKKYSKIKGFNYSLWLPQENIAYANFLKDRYSSFLLSSTEKRLMGINVQMSKAVKTRSVDQCRSHHQKMMKYHKTIPNIVEYLLIKNKALQKDQHMDCDENKVKAQQGDAL